MTHAELLAFCERAGLPPSVVLGLVVACVRSPLWAKRIAWAVQEDMAARGLTPELELIVLEYGGERVA